MTSPANQTVPAFSADRAFPYVLLSSTLGAVISLAVVWIMTAHTVAPMLFA